jgi:hypothetical protein
MKQKYNIGDIIYTIWYGKGVIIKERKNNTNIDYYNVFMFSNNRYNTKPHVSSLRAVEFFKTREEADKKRKCILGLIN